MVAATAGPPDARHPEPTPTNPFHGLETVAQALHRLEDERAARNEPREQYRALQTQLHTLRREREQLDKPWSPYEHSPLDRVRSLRHNAGVDVSQLTARLQHSLWRDRRHVRHLLSDATARLDAAEVAFRETYQHEAGRLDPLIAAATDQLEQTPRPEPVGVRDRELEETIGWFRWEISVGNGDRPTLDALHQRRDGLDRAASGRRLSWGEQAVHQAVGDELDGRGVQYQQAVDSQRRQQHALERMRMPVRVRDVGPELGL